MAHADHAHLTDSESVYEGVKFDVCRLELTGRDGERVKREVVVPADAVVIVPMLDTMSGGQEVVLIRNERFAVGRSLWELPAGTREAGEDAQTTAGRELVEETGYQAGALRQLFAFYPSPGFCTERLTAFQATDLTHQAQRLDPTERITVETMPLTRALEMIRTNEIEDAKTIATLLYAQVYLMGG